jgi:methylated-DNA-[protein]-cysteine S-methyltransferase
MKQDIFKTPWGWIGIAATARGVMAVVLPKPTRRAVECEMEDAGAVDETSSNGAGGTAASHLKAARVAVEAYLRGKSRSFDVPVDLEGQPSFRRKVWEVLKTIPYGRVRSYGWVARKVGKPRAARAVGAACGANPVPLFVPCHRVVAGDGSLGGFSGGLPNKKRLLRLEGTRLR